jgi:hypothetical protein
VNKLGRLGGASCRRQLREILRQEFVDQNMKPGERLAPETNLALRFGDGRFVMCRAPYPFVHQQAPSIFLARTTCPGVPKFPNAMIPAKTTTGAALGLGKRR